MSVSARLSALETSGIKLGLSNISRICQALGDPQCAYATVHVAGTNGKGSVVAMVHAALRAAGWRSARYTSPHLSSILERFVIDDAPVGADQFERTGTRVLDVIDTLVSSGALPAPPTYFEATTAIAFALFRDAGVQVSVVEVGLGGRFDSTNVVTPAVTAITSIALDHEGFLGTSRAAIAFEKAGIIKARTPVVLGDLPADASAVIRAVAAELDAPVIPASQPGDASLPVSAGHATLVPASGPLAGQPVTIGLAGAHQAGNARVAYRLLEELTRQGAVPVPPSAVRHGLERAHWPGRLEETLHGDGHRLILDAAHNPDGAQALAAHLRAWCPDRPALVFAAMLDKNIPGMLAHLLPVVGPVVLTPLASARAAAPDVVAQHIRALDGARAVTIAPDAAEALAQAERLTPAVVIAGSIVLLGEVRDALNPRAILR